MWIHWEEEAKMQQRDLESGSHAKRAVFPGGGNGKAFHGQSHTHRGPPVTLNGADLVHGSLPYVLLPVMLFLVCLNKTNQPTNEHVTEKGRAR